MLATLTDAAFDDPDWVFETKWDGFRMVAVVQKGSRDLVFAQWENRQRHLHADRESLRKY